MQDLAEEIKRTVFKITRVGEHVGREVSRRLGVPFGVVDISLAPTSTPGDSVAEILELIEDAALEFRVGLPPEMVRGKETFVLRVSGDSMIEDQIRDGDYVVVESRSEAQDGETVVALIRGEEATLKKLYREGPTIRLQPANEAMESFSVPDIISPG